MKKTEETYFNMFPLYTSHNLKCEDILASYDTYFFGFIAIARYEDSEIEASSICICEPLKRLLMGEEYTDSLDEITRQIHEERSNIKKVRFRK